MTTVDEVGPAFPCVVFDLDGTITAPSSTRPAPGMPELIAALHAGGTPLALATSASASVARGVLSELGVLGCFAAVAGRGIDGGFAGKDVVVGEALLGLGMTPVEPGGLLVGDSPADLAAARDHGLVPVGVAWGSSPPSALWAAGAVAVLGAPADLWALAV